MLTNLRQDAVSLAFERGQDRHDSVSAVDGVDAGIIRGARDGDVLGNWGGDGLNHAEDGESDESNA